MSELDAVTAQRLQAVTDRRRTVLAGALDALALARTNAARSARAIEVAAAGTTVEATGTGAAPDGGGWGRRPDRTEIVVDGPDGDDPVPATTPAAPVRRADAGRPSEAPAGDDELEGRNWLR